MKKTTTILSTKKASARSILQKLCPMRSRGLAALAAAFGLVLSTGHASAAGANWNDSTGGNNWFTATNWTPNGVPTSATSVVSIDFTGTGQFADIFGGTAAAAGDLVVGNASAGTLSFGASGGNGLGATPGLGSAGGTLNVTHTVTLGLTSSGNGNIYVFNGTNGGTSGDSLMTVGGLFSIGGNSTPGGGSGTLTINATSAVSTSTAIVNANDGLVLDAQATQTATVLVTGNQAALNVLANSVSTNALVLGNSATGSGTNSVTFTDGSGTGTNKNTITGNIILGNGGSSATATNTLTVTNGATLTQASSSGFVALTVGNNDRGTDTVTVTNGATLNASNVAFAQIGNGAGTTGTVNVTNGGTLSVFFTIVGDNGTGNLNINTGGTFNTDGIAVGLESTGTGTGTVTIISGGTLASGGGSYIGDGGTGTVNVGTGTTALTDHGTFNAANLFVGDDSTGTLNGEGARSLTTVTGTLSVGQDDDDALAPAGNGTVALSQGATLNVNTTGNVEVGVNGSLGPVIVAGTGLITLTTGATLNALTTGALSTAGTGTFTIGHDLNQVTPGTVTGTVKVGDLTATVSAMGTSPTATATLSVDSLVVGASGLGELIVAGAGSGQVPVPATVNVGTGNVTMGTGTTYVAAFTTTYFGLGTVTITEGGILDANAAGAAGTGTFIVGDNGVSTGVNIRDSPFTNSNVVNVGLGATDTATLDTDKLDVGDTSSGVVIVNGTHALVNVGTGNLTVGDTATGQGILAIYNGGTVDANSTTATAGQTIVGNATGSNGTIVLGQDATFSSQGPGTLTADTMIVGNAGQAHLVVYNGSTATVTNPGGATDALIIANQGGSYGEIDVQGASSMLTVTTGALLIGNASGSQGELDVNGNGTADVDAGNLHVGSTSGGLGELFVNDDGNLNVTGNLDVDNGYVQEIDPSIINVTSNVNVSAGNTYYGGGDSVLNLGTPSGAPTVFTDFNNAGTLFVTDSLSVPPSLAPSSTTFTINGNYVGQGGTIQFITLLNNGAPAVTGELIVNGTTSGNSLVHINSAIGSTGGQTTGNGIQIESSPNGGNDGAFALNSRVVAGDYDYSLLQIDSGSAAGLYLQSHVSPEVVGATSVAAAQQYLELASLDSLVQREGELEATYQAETNASWGDPKSGDPKAMAPTASSSPAYKTSEVWTRGIYRNDDVHTSVGLHQDSGVGQIGGDYQFRGLAGANDRLYVGGLADYGQSSGHTTVDDVGIDGSDVGFGAYLTYLNGGLYADAVVKGNVSHEKVKTQYGDFGANGTGVSASLESGYAFNVGSGVKVEPQAQLVYENESYNQSTDDLGRTYDFNDPDFLEARWGVRVDKSFEYSPGLHITPYLRVNGLEQILGDNKVTVDGTTFNEDIGGLSFAVDGGVTADVCDNVALYINGNSAWGDKDDSYGATGGVKISW